MHMRSDVYESNGVIHVEIEVPGFSLDQVEVWVGCDRVEVSIRPEKAIRENTAPRDSDDVTVASGRNFHRRERLRRVYRRVIPLPMEVDGEVATARLSEGLLILDLPLCEDVDKPEERCRVSIREAGRRRPGAN